MGKPKKKTQGILREEMSEKGKNMKNQKRRMKHTTRQGFTLIELLVVVAIIAVIGAGVAVTYQRLDDQAKTAMEISDIAILKKVNKHWSAVNGYDLPNELDSLVDNEGNLYTPVQSGPGGFTTIPSSSAARGLNGPIGYATAEVAEAPDIVLSNLAAAGMTLTYTHLVSRTNANDSTFDTGGFGQDVETSDTLTTLVAGDSEARAQAQLVVDADDTGHDYDGPDDVEGNGDDVDFTAGSASYQTAAAFATAQADSQDILDANTTDQLAFVFPGGGQQIGGSPGFSNLTDEIITNAGLKPEQVAVPGVAPSGEQQYYLVVMGFGRFASIYRGKAVRADAPSVGKRLPQNDEFYSRYLAVIRVPITAYGSPSAPDNEPPVLVDVLSPQGYSAAALRDNFIDDQAKVQDNS